MKFQACVDQCTTEGTHCQGCGRSHQEIAETRALVKNAVDFIRRQEYENPDEFVAAIGRSTLKKLTKPQ